jgi:hypothetical protein
MLGGFLSLGLWLVRALTRQAAPGAHDPEWTGPRVAFPAGSNPITLFVRIARAVHLAIALRLKIEQEIADLLAGKSPSAVAPAAEATRTGLAESRGEEVAEVEEVENLHGSPRPEVLPREIREPLGESDRFHRLLNGPLKDAVAAICADLGLGPDWSLWTEDGFPPPPGGDVRVWDIFRPAGIETPPPQEVESAGDIVWRPRWRRPRRSRAKPPLDPRCDRGPDTWPDFNDFYFSDTP